MKKSPRNTVLGPRADQTYLFANKTKLSCKSLSATRIKDFNSSTSTRMRVCSCVFVTLRQHSSYTCATCQKVRLICPEGLNQCFEGFIPPEIASESNFDLESHLVLFLRRFASKTVDALVKSSEQK